MRTIYIRHADKDFQNGNSDYFKHDPGITENGVERTKIIGKKLIELYGEPDKIFSSPYRRTRETALLLSNLLENPLDISVDANLSEYLGNHPNVKLDVTYHTSIYEPPHPEEFKDMLKRVDKHIEKNRKRAYKNQNAGKTVWIVTHGLIIKQIAKIFGIKSSKELPYLTCFSVIEKEDLVRGEFLLFKSMIENSYNYNRKNSERILISPRSEYTGRDDISGRTYCHVVKNR